MKKKEEERAAQAVEKSDAGNHRGGKYDRDHHRGNGGGFGKDREYKHDARGSSKRESGRSHPHSGGSSNFIGKRTSKGW